MAPAVDARVAVLDVALRQRAARADRRLEPRPALVRPRGGPDRAARLPARRGSRAGIVTRHGEKYAEVAAPVRARSVVLLASPLRAQLQTVSVVRRRLLIAGGVSTVFAVLVGYAGASLFARRLRRLEQAAERIAAGNFEEPVVDAGRDEVGQLARGFERMRLRLSRARPRPRRVHRQRLARAANAALLAQRLPRAARGAGARRRRRGRSSSPRCASRWRASRSSRPTCSTCPGSTPAG